MIWTSAAEFWAMGGYAEFVWGSMGVSAALLAVEVLLTRLGRRQALDAVCEAMEAEAQDVQDEQARLRASPGAARMNPWSPGAST